MPKDKVVIAVRNLVKNNKADELQNVTECVCLEKLSLITENATPT